MRLLASTVGLLSLGAAIAPVQAGPIKTRKPHYQVHHDRMRAIKDTFQIGWDGYMKYAYPHDALLPNTNGWSDYRNGWGASAIDAMSTAVVMGKTDVIKQILDHIQTVNFYVAVDQVSTFETTIRYLGGMLSGYDLLKGPFKRFVTNETAVDNVLVQATNLAENLKVAFNTTTGIPDNTLNFNPPSTAGSTDNGIATIGTLILEWTRLSDLTGNDEYYELAAKGESYLLDPQPKSSEPFPGLIGTNVNISNGQLLDATGGWVGGDDSFYEYLIKMYLYDPVRFATYKDRWVLAVESSIKYLASHPSSRPDLTFLAMFNGSTPIFASEHLACFDGGNIILGGLILDEQRYVDFGIALTSACHDTYTATLTRIGPEQFAWQDDGHLLPVNGTGNGGPPANLTDFFDTSGYWITDAGYDLRPEVIESYYYAYRATGDTKYQDWAWDAFLAINKTCAAGSGYSSVTDVNAANGGSSSNFQESFWFAEVLKYAYLIQSDDGEFQVQPDHTNKFVFNTECHPLLIPGGEKLS